MHNQLDLWPILPGCKDIYLLLKNTEDICSQIQNWNHQFALFSVRNMHWHYEYSRFLPICHKTMHHICRTCKMDILIKEEMTSYRFIAVYKFLRLVKKEFSFKLLQVMRRLRTVVILQKATESSYNPKKKIFSNDSWKIPNSSMDYNLF